MNEIKHKKRMKANTLRASINDFGWFLPFHIDTRKLECRERTKKKTSTQTNKSNDKKTNCRDDDEEEEKKPKNRVYLAYWVLYMCVCVCVLYIFLDSFLPRNAIFFSLPLPLNTLKTTNVREYFNKIQTKQKTFFLCCFRWVLR